jgi:hypothetical protein
MEHNQMTSITRRSLTLGLGASAALAAASPPMVADAAWQRTVLPSVASRKIGAVQVTAVSDGFIDVPGRRLGRQRRYLAAWCNNDRHLSTHEIGGERGQAIVLSVSPAIVQGDVSTLEESGIIQALPDHRNERRVDGGRTGAENADHRHRWLLRVRRERPRSRAAEQRDELAAPDAKCHLIPPAGRATEG